MSNTPKDLRAKRDWGDDDSRTPILHVDMDSFFAQVEILEDPSLRGRPVIVGGTSGRGVVTSATYEARALGVRAGMPMARARTACPDAIIVSGHRHLYSTYSRRVMTIISDITPDVEQVSIDEAFLDVSGARRRLGPPVAIGRLLRSRIRQEVGLPASVGIAAVKSVAKIASANAKPDGMLLIPESATVDFLHGLPVGALWGVGGVTQSRLDREGIVTIGDLARLDLQRLVRLLGPAQAHHLHDLAWGKDPRPVRPRPQEKSVGTETTFEEDVTSRERIDKFLLSASHECARRLRDQDKLAWTVVLKLRDSSFSTITRSQTLMAPTDVAQVVYQTVKGLLDVAGMPVGGVRLCGVRCEGLHSRADGVVTLLDDDGHPAASERAMDSVHTRFGHEALRPASLIPRGAENESLPDRGKH